LNYYFEHIRERRILNPDQGVSKLHVCRTRHRQEFSNSLYNSNDYGLDNAHLEL